ncbi:C40 family peptidase [Streptomyces fuscigenes]|uniref:C40 family peptidase n=1 Tax=Streptomyces fuscigenes TaxID=1528880 RepID=UPI001F1C2F16|nr:C40 family peptidase [Streptomyces fuscigenes]MCF3961728.1 C40 family peptidase [Streptomyces fuscigenes]
MVSHRRPPVSGPGRGARIGSVTALSAAAAAAAALGSPQADAQPRDTPEAGRAAVDSLLAQAERATDQYNAASDRVTDLAAQVRRAQDDTARGQQRVNTMRGVLSSVVGAQYRSGGIDPSLALLLTSDPDTYLERASLLDQVGAQETGALHRLQEAERELRQHRSVAAHDLADLRAGRAAVARHKRTVQARLARARALLGDLPAGDRDPFGRASRGAGRDLLGIPDGPAGPASARAAAAVAAAQSALGRPYIWGANGPGGFDCSGLMQWAYARAGVGLPRTSQAQRYAGRRIPLSEARPGDLVAYRADASHIAMYVGHGQVIHAPYPGARVRYDPVGMLPISSVTRV